MQLKHPIHPLDPKLTFWCVLYYLSAFETICCLMKLGAKWAELVQKFVKRSRIGILRNERTRSTPLDRIMTFWCVRTIWVHSGLFGFLTKLGAKQAELGQKFVRRSRVGIFRNECTRSTPLDPKLMFWCDSYYLGAFGTVWLLYETRCKTGRTSAKVRASKWRRNFLQRTHRSTPCDLKLTFGAFGAVWLPYETRCKTGRTSAKVRADKVVSEFFAANAPNPTHWTLN